MRRAFFLIELPAARKCGRLAFTLIELLVVIAIIAVLVTILVPVVMTALGKSETTVCQNNLGVIGRKYNDYANDSDYADVPFPRHLTLGDANDVTGTGLAMTSGDANGDLFGTVNAADIGFCGMQTVWVLIELGLIPDSAFKCPGDQGYEARAGVGLLKYGWTDLKQFSYGVHYPYDGKALAGDNLADPMDKDSKGRFRYRENMPLFADRNPGGAVGAMLTDGTTKRSHSNHSGNDGGVLTVSRIGNTTFHKPVEDPPDSGTFLSDSRLAGDNLYTMSTVGEGTALPASIPFDAKDTIITPVISRTDDPT